MKFVPKMGSKWAELEETCMRLRKMARQLNTPIICNLYPMGRRPIHPRSHQELPNEPP
jgi:hypothetical protein